MTTRALLAAMAALHAAPALAVVDPPAASPSDGRMRVIPYDRTNPVQLYAAPGASLRISARGGRGRGPGHGVRPRVYLGHAR